MSPCEVVHDLDKWALATRLCIVCPYPACVPSPAIGAKPLSRSNNGCRWKAPMGYHFRSMAVVRTCTRRPDPGDPSYRLFGMGRVARLEGWILLLSLLLLLMLLTLLPLLCPPSPLSPARSSSKGGIILSGGSYSTLEAW